MLEDRSCESYEHASRQQPGAGSLLECPEEPRKLRRDCRPEVAPGKRTGAASECRRSEDCVSDDAGIDVGRPFACHEIEERSRVGAVTEQQPRRPAQISEANSGEGALRHTVRVLL